MAKWVENVDDSAIQRFKKKTGEKRKEIGEPQKSDSPTRLQSRKNENVFLRYNRRRPLAPPPAA